jgi:hypothetical protein
MILMLADGFGPAAATLAREVKAAAAGDDVCGDNADDDASVMVLMHVMAMPLLMQLQDERTVTRH